MPQALPLSDRISQSSSRTRQFRVRRAQFGDGYEQVVNDGINNQVDRWSIAYDRLDSTERATVWTAINQVGGADYFTWTPPGGSAAKWRIDGEVNEVPESGNIYSVRFTLRQVFV